MRVFFNVTEEQNKFLKDHPDFDLQDWFKNALDKKFSEIKTEGERVNAVIAAASYHLSMPKINSGTPRSMLKIKGKSLLERQIEVLKKFNINDITVVRGYKKEQLVVSGVNYIDNNEYETTGILHSFFLASEKITGKTILLYGDILFEGDIIKKLIFQTFDFAVIVDRSWREHYHNRVQHTISEAELVEVRGDLVSRMGRGIPYDSAYGEFIGMVALSGRGAEKAKALYDELKDTPEKNIQGAEQLSRSSLTDFFNILIAKGEKIKSVNVFGGWFEIDTFEDYRKSWTIVR